MITYLQQLNTDTGCNMEDRPAAMDDFDEWWETVGEIRASSMSWCRETSCNSGIYLVSSLWVDAERPRGIVAYI